MTAPGQLRKNIRRYLSGSASDQEIPENRVRGVVRESLLYLFLILLVFHVYANSKDGPFVFDDIDNIVDNPHIRVTRLDWQALKRAAFESPLPTRPVANVSFALNYYFNQLDPKSYRLVNVLIHLGNGFLLLLLFKATLLTPPLKNRYREVYRFMPFAAVTVWIVNPLHTQSVSYIVQRMNLMAAFFCLLTFLLYIHARLAKKRRSRWFLWGGSGLAFLLAMGSKENSITLPFFIYLYEWYFFRDLDFEWLKRSFHWPLAIMLFWAAMALVYLDFNPVDNILSAYQSRDFTLIQRVMTQSRVVLFYIFLFLFPHPSRLNLDHYFPVSTSLLAPPTTMLSILVIIALLTAAIYHARRERLLSFAVLWFLGNLVVESSVIGLEMVFEHRTYLPTVLVSMLLVTILYRAAANVWLRRAVLAGMVAVGTVWTHDRNALWADDISLWNDSMKKSPQKVRPYVNLGITYGGRGQLDQSIWFLKQAVHLKPDYRKPRYNLALSLVGRGDYRQGDFREAEQHARQVLDENPNDAAALNILAMSLANQNKFEQALDHYYKSLQLEPDDEYVHFYISQILAYTGQISEAARYCSEALRLKPDYDEARLHLHRIRRQIEWRKPEIDKPFGD